MAKNDTPAANAGTGSKGQNGAKAKSPGSTAGLEVSSKVEGFRRAGFAWSKEPTRIPVDQLTDAQIAALTAEPNLSVRVVDLSENAE